MNEFERYSRMAERIKKEYPKGTRIQLNEMNDPYSPVPSGTRGTVDVVDDQAQIHMKWDNGRTLALIPDIDSFRKLTEEEVKEERMTKATKSDFAKYTVCLDYSDKPYSAYDTQQLWNGWECPLFTKEVGKELCAAIQEENCKLSYNAEKDCFVANYPYEELSSEYEGTDYVIDGELVRLYPIGSKEWTWCKAKISLDDSEENDSICIEETVDEIIDEEFQQSM